MANLGQEHGMHLNGCACQGRNVTILAPRFSLETAGATLDFPSYHPADEATLHHSHVMNSYFFPPFCNFRVFEELFDTPPAQISDFVGTIFALHQSVHHRQKSVLRVG
ncbi:hypothetical protein NL676_026679 [Syzygium grande]|nr:hypothetical protein NL676_026679 [Syzygium grande]